MPAITYSVELLRHIQQCTTSIEFLKSNFTAKGCEATVRDKYDGQLYKIKVEPIYEQEKSNGKTIKDLRDGAGVS